MSAPETDSAEYEVSAPHTRGGQHAGVSSTITVRHIPTGLTATCSEHRTQLANKRAALEAVRAMQRAAKYIDQHRVWR